MLRGIAVVRGEDTLIAIRVEGYYHIMLSTVPVEALRTFVIERLPTLETLRIDVRSSEIMLARL